MDDESKMKRTLRRAPSPRWYQQARQRRGGSLAVRLQKSWVSEVVVGKFLRSWYVIPILGRVSELLRAERAPHARSRT